MPKQTLVFCFRQCVHHEGSFAFNMATWSTMKKYQPQVSTEKAYVCTHPGCDKAYNALRNLIRHEIKKHGRAFKKRTQTTQGKELTDVRKSSNVS